MRVRAALPLLAAPVLALAGEGRLAHVGPFCTGEYGDVLTALRPEVRAFEASSKASYAYLIRATATYEHISYGRDGRIRRQYIRHVRHGTAFAYRAAGGQWLVATNEHVARHPEVTGGDDTVEGVPAGSRKVREVLRIVKSESSEDEREQIPLTVVAADEALDVAILSSRVPLQIMPYRIGHSSALQVGNAVQVRGYPLGVFAASNTGRVIGLAQRDREHGWSHEDFAVDALLNAGNSGSPVFAVSCRTGELELVGIYHAGYRDAQALNVVVSIDQVRDLLEDPWAPRRRPPAEEAAPDRAALREVLARSGPVVMPFGDRAAEARADGDAVRFSVFEADWPLGARAHLSLRSGGASPSSLIVPRLGRVSSLEILGPELRESVVRLEEALWRQLQAVLGYRAAESLGRPDAGDALAAAAAQIRGRADDQRDALQIVDFASEIAAAPADPPSMVGPPSRPGFAGPSISPASDVTPRSSPDLPGARAGSGR
jgi:hypothetical protein